MTRLRSTETPDLTMTPPWLKYGAGFVFPEVLFFTLEGTVTCQH